jgi:hypothetical protein
MFFVLKDTDQTVNPDAEAVEECPGFFACR